MLAEKQTPPRHEIDDSESTQVLLRPNDNDLFVRTGKQVIEACRLNISLELWIAEINGMIERVAEWSGNRADRVALCFCMPRGSAIALFFVPRSESFDFDLADELTAFASELVKTFNVGMIETMQIPQSEITRFVDLRSAKLVYGEQPRSYPPVEA